MASSILSLGISALNAANIGLQTTSHNISNANTPNYSRQSLIQTTAIAQFTGGGYLGKGVEISTIRRSYDDFLESQVRESKSRGSYYDTYYNSVSQLDNLVSDSSAGLQPALTDFFSGVNNVSQNPGSTSARQSMLSSSQTLIDRFSLLQGRMDELEAATNTQIKNSVQNINGYATQIADLNKQIALATASGQQSQTPNDLLDRRDALLSDLSQEIGITTVKQDDGSINLFLGSGQSLVVGSKSFDLTTYADPENAARLAVGVSNGSSVTKFSISDLGMGNITGAMTFRDKSLTPAENELGRIAATFAHSFNEQHKAGLDLNGNAGASYFTEAQPQVLRNMDNTSTAAASVSVSDYSKLVASDYRLSYDGTNYNVTRLSDGKQMASAQPASYPLAVDGLQISLSGGAPNLGESFLIQPYANSTRDMALAVNDPTQIAAASPVTSSAALTNTGTAKISAATPIIPVPTGADYSSPVQIQFTSATQYVIRTGVDANGDGLLDTASAATTLPADGKISMNGWSVNITGAMAKNDVFNIKHTSNPSGNSGNVLALAGLQTQKLFNNGNSSLMDAFGSMVTAIGGTTRQMETSSKAQATLAEQTQTQRDSLSGVNLDEEAANLIRYQQAYQAAGKMISIASQLFEEVINMMR